jgi:SAM-dependent methyltransferase
MKLINKIKWATRRIYLKGIPREALVLEVGSGGNPYPRSNVLVDAYEDTRERHWEPLIHDRPTVISFVEDLPFKDKSFDYVVAAHVLEHSPYPEKFLTELQRVAKAGYIETPDAIMERLNPYKDHRLEITERFGELLIRKKSYWTTDSELVELYESKVKEIITKDVIPNNAEAFHVRFYWEDNINHKVLNPLVDCIWVPTDLDSDAQKKKRDIVYHLRNLILIIIRKLFSQNKRNKNLDILSLLRCKYCHSDVWNIVTKSNIECMNCHSSIEIENNIYKIK